MVFKPKGAHIWKVRVTAADGRSAILSTGCTDREDAADVERAVKVWEGKKGKKEHARPALITALVEKRVTLRAAYDGQHDGTLDYVLAEAPTEPAPKAARNLTALVDAWVAARVKPDDTKPSKHARRRKRRKTSPRVVADQRRMLERVFPEIAAGTFTVKHIARAEIAQRLDLLPFADPTKNRYRTSVSQFLRYLVRTDVIETNVVRDVEGFGEHEERVVYYERPEAQRLIAGMPQPEAAMAAFGCGFAADAGSLAPALVRDFDLTPGAEGIYIRGTKTGTRLRRVPLVDENRWVLPYLVKALEGKAPNARVFPTMDGTSKARTDLLRVQRRVAQALGVIAVGEDLFGTHSFRDWRHTHAVQLLRDGYDEAIPAAHLGHANTTLVRTRYGRFIVTAADYHRKRVPQPVPATDSATSAPAAPLRRAK